MILSRSVVRKSDIRKRESGTDQPALTGGVSKVSLSVSRFSSFNLEGESKLANGSGDGGLSCIFDATAFGNERDSGRAGLVSFLRDDEFASDLIGIGLLLVPLPVDTSSLVAAA
jgi:hypothetical protein